MVNTDAVVMGVPDLRENVIVFSVIAIVLTIALASFFLLMWLRFGFDWVRVLAPSWRPRGLILFIAETSYTVTDPPIRAVRRIIPPLKVGGAALDFAWSVVLLLCIVAFAIVGWIGEID